MPGLDLPDPLTKWWILDLLGQILDLREKAEVGKIPAGQILAGPGPGWAWARADPARLGLAGSPKLDPKNVKLLRK